MIGAACRYARLKTFRCATSKSCSNSAHCQLLFVRENRFLLSINGRFVLSDDNELTLVFFCSMQDRDPKATYERGYEKLKGKMDGEQSCLKFKQKNSVIIVCQPFRCAANVAERADKKKQQLNRRLRMRTQQVRFILIINSGSLADLIWMLSNRSAGLFQVPGVCLRLVPARRLPSVAASDAVKKQ